MSDITIKLVDNKDELLEIYPLKQNNDNQYGQKWSTNPEVTGDRALEKLESLFDLEYFFWSVKYNEETIGFSNGKIDEDSFRIGDFYIEPEYRNKKIENLLLKNIISFAKREKCDDLELTISDSYTSAIKACEEFNAELKMNNNNVSTYKMNLNQK